MHIDLDYKYIMLLTKQIRPQSQVSIQKERLAKTSKTNAKVGRTLSNNQDLKREFKAHWDQALQAWVKYNVLEEETRHGEAYKKVFGELIGKERRKVLDVGTGFGYVATLF